MTFSEAIMNLPMRNFVGILAAAAFVLMQSSGIAHADPPPLAIAVEHKGTEIARFAAVEGATYDVPASYCDDDVSLRYDADLSTPGRAVAVEADIAAYVRRTATGCRLIVKTARRIERAVEPRRGGGEDTLPERDE
jgi:hypothetical protein